MSEKIYLTKKGLERIKKEYQDLKNLKIIRLAKAEENFDLSESKIAELEYVFKNAELIKIPSKEKQDTVNLGATVTLENSDGKIKEYEIVGTLEASPSEGRISSESPVGKALLNHKVSDEIEINSPIKIIYKIKKIRY
ncbi:MAG: GreA/GreB family elongation factor [bacterium]|nr:GreA/GreB family elongation factor [bacterium]